MTIAELINQARERLAQLLTERQTHTDQLAAMRADESLTVEAVEAVRTARGAIDAQIDEIRARIAELETEQARDAAIEALQREIVPDTQRRGYDNQVRTGAEPAAYSPDNSRTVSFFADAFAASVGGVSRESRERLERNEREFRMSMPQDMVARATTTSSFAGLVVPQYLVDLAANALRFGRPLANAITRLPIPEQGMSFILPVASTGVSEASQATENSAVSNTDQVWANVTVPVASIAGQEQVSRQSLERGTPGIDGLIYSDLAAAYAAELDRQLYVGTGASGQLTGMNGTSGIFVSTAYGAAATNATCYTKLGGAIAAIAGAGSAVTPQLIVMHPRRWGAFTAALDSSNRPWFVPVQNGPYNALGINMLPGGYSGDGDPVAQGFRVVGEMHGLPVITDANVPTNLGGGSTEDVIFVLDTRHALLFEDGDGAPRQLRFEQIQVSGTAGFGATVTLAAYNYSAFTAGRYPKAFCRVGGADASGANGQQNPSLL